MITPSPAVGKPAKPAPVAPKTVPAKSPTDATHTTKQYTLNRGVARGSHKVVIYGAGGIGKSELASLVAGVGFSPVFIDIEEGSSFLDVARVEPTPQTFPRRTWAMLSSLTHSLRPKNWRWHTRS
jgi:hypothetical protein